MKNPGAPFYYRRFIKGVDIIPNLYHRLLWIKGLLRREQKECKMPRPIIFENRHDEDIWIISYELTSDGTCRKRYISKHPAIELEVQLTPSGQLFLLQIPENPPEIKAFLLGEVRRLDLRYS